MGKMLNALMIVLAIEITLYIFVVPEQAVGDYTSIFDFLLNLQNWANMQWYEILFNSVETIGAATIIAGSIITARDWVWRAGLVTGSILTFGAATIKLFQFIISHITDYTSASTSISTGIAMIMVAPIVMYFIFASLDFISGKD